MDDRIIMHELNGIEKMTQKIGGFRFSQSFPSLYHFIQTLVVTKLKQNVAVAAVLKVVLVLTDVSVFQSAMNFYLGLKLKKQGSTFCVSGVARGR